MNLGVTIKELRKTHHLSQDSFAEKFNVTRQTVSNWENEKSYPDLDTILKISSEFNITVDELLKGDTGLVKTIDGEKKKKNILAVALMSICLLFLVMLFVGYRYNQVANHVAFSMQNDQTLQLNKNSHNETEIATGYVALPRSGKVALTAQGSIDSGTIAIIVRKDNGQTVYQIDGDTLEDSQTLQLKKGSYMIQITANDYTEKTVSLSYDVNLKNQ